MKGAGDFTRPFHLALIPLEIHPSTFRSGREGVDDFGDAPGEIYQALLESFQD